MAKDYQLPDLTAKSLDSFRERLEADKDFALEYLVRKMGFNSKDSDQFDQAIDIYTDKDLVTTKKHKTGEYICQMHQSLSGKEFDACCKNANKALADLFLQ